MVDMGFYVGMIRPLPNSSCKIHVLSANHSNIDHSSDEDALEDGMRTAPQAAELIVSFAGLLLVRRRCRPESSV